MKYREAAKKLKALGCEEVARRGKGSHRLWHRALLKQLDLDWEKFQKA
ncbi:MAG: hypothetical protein L6Q26_05770 [Anaerolineales bacterium]|nr:hypothetical protein [Anaerolineales bacterium]NUQ86589.1 hypothetical protein [Anaerolineales bacterium]